MSTASPAVPAVQGPPAQYEPSWMLSVVQRLNTLVGKANNVATLTLRANQATTVLTDSRLYANTVFTFTPLTADAAAVQASIYVTAQAKGTATINHTNSASADKSFGVAFHG